MVNNGTKAVRKDHRRYSFHRTFGGTTAIPDEFNLDAGLTMPDQDTDGLPMGCTGYALTEVCQDKDKIIYKPRYSYDKSLQIDGIDPGDPQFEHVGIELTTGLKSGIVYGVQGANETTDAEALKHRIGDYYDAIDGSGMDCFDSLRSAMWNTNQSLYVGTPWLAFWSDPQAGVIPDTEIKPTASTPWHCWKICGTKKINGQIYLIGKTWQGTNYGDNGWAYFSRIVINKVFAISGSVAFVLVPYSGQTIQTVKLSIISTIISYIRLLFTKLTPTPVTTPLSTPEPVQTTTQPVVTPAPVEAPVEVLLWDNPTNVRHSVRVMCDNADLPVDQKNVLCACVEVESQFNPQAIHVNKDPRTGEVSSTDYGLCQVNDFWHIGPSKDFVSADYVLAHPEACVAWMIQMFKDGKQSMWVSFTSGAYKQYL